MADVAVAGFSPFSEIENSPFLVDFVLLFVASGAGFAGFSGESEFPIDTPRPPEGGVVLSGLRTGGSAGLTVARVEDSALRAGGTPSGESGERDAGAVFSDLWCGVVVSDVSFPKFLRDSGMGTGLPM